MSWAGLHCGDLGKDVAHRKFSQTLSSGYGYVAQGVNHFLGLQQRSYLAVVVVVQGRCCLLSSGWPQRGETEPFSSQLLDTSPLCVLCGFNSRGGLRNACISRRRWAHAVRGATILRSAQLNVTLICHCCLPLSLILCLRPCERASAQMWRVAGALHVTRLSLYFVAAYCKIGCKATLPVSGRRAYRSVNGAVLVLVCCWNLIKIFDLELLL